MFGRPFNVLRRNLGLLLRQDLAERVYRDRANLAVSIVSVLYSGHSRSLCNLILREAA